MSIYYVSLIEKETQILSCSIKEHDNKCTIHSISNNTNRGCLIFKSIKYAPLYKDLLNFRIQLEILNFINYTLNFSRKQRYISILSQYIVMHLHLVVGPQDNNIFINIPSKYSNLWVFNAHISFILSIDWSAEK